MKNKKLSISEYRSNLVEKRGEGFIDDFDSVFSGDITLADIAKRYKLSKMRCSQIFKRLYGKNFRSVVTDGGAMDLAGVYRAFEPGKNHRFMVTITDEQYIAIQSASAERNCSMADIVRDSIVTYFNKNTDGLEKLSKIFSKSKMNLFKK